MPTMCKRFEQYHPSRSGRGGASMVSRRPGSAGVAPIGTWSFIAGRPYSMRKGVGVRSYDETVAFSKDDPESSR
jgi:hypothetical protein